MKALHAAAHCLVLDGVYRRTEGEPVFQDGIQQIQKLLGTEGVDVVGPLPRELQDYVVFSGAVMASAINVDPSRTLLKRLTTAEAASVMRTKKMEPGTP